MTGFAGRVARPVVMFSEWFFGRGLPGIDLFLGLLSAGWFALMLSKPEMFDRGNFIGMAIMPDPAWIFVFGSLVCLHAAGTVRPGWRNLRMGAALLSAWVWLFLAFALAGVEFSTGTWAYALVGILAAIAAIYLSGLPRARAG